MHAFRDTTGRTWELTINVAQVKRVRAHLNIDLVKLTEDSFKPLGELLADVVRLVDVLYVLCQDDARREELTDEDFGRGLGGDSLFDASEAFVEELTDFFPDARTRTGVRAVLERGRKIRDRLVSETMRLVEQIDPETEAKKLIASFTSSPEPSASTPTLLPFASSS